MFKSIETSSPRHLITASIAAALSLFALLPAFVEAADSNSSTRVILQRRSANSAAQSEQEFLNSLTRDTGQQWRRLHGRIGEMEVLQLESGALQQETLRKLRARGDMEYAVIDGRKKAHAVPNDSLFAGQWYLQDVQPAGIAANVAWDTTTGSAGTVIAVLDSGVRFDHPDLASAAQNGKLLPGYDFVGPDGTSGTQFLTANDGDGWDPDPSDPGDWIDSADQAKPFFSGCTIENSSWHGTRVSGIIAAATNNSIGIAGTTWKSWILPVRVLGKCGGYDSDIITAMRWAAGLQVSGVPTNPYPAKIINLSLGSDGACTQPYIDVIQQLAQLGVIVVASAGNSGGPVGEPANCPGAVGVAGLRQIGTKVGYSSLGPETAVAAPAGNCVNLSGACLFSLDTTYDTGTKGPVGPGYTDQFNTNLGTSFSAPLATGVVALMHSMNAKLTVPQLRARLMEGSRAFPTSSTTTPAPPVCHVPTGATDLQNAECICTTSTCGAGMLYAPGAVVAAQRPIASVVTPASVVAGTTLNLDGSASSASCNRSLTTYLWTVVSTQGATPTISNSDKSIAQVTVPASGTFTLRLTVTDNMGATDTANVVITSTTTSTPATPPLAGAACPASIIVTQSPPPPPTPTPAPQSSGGGGNFGIGWLFAILVLGFYRRASSN